jgi:DNA-binding transcriptional regulator PaaX
MVNVETRNNQIYISLTQKGKHRAGRFQIDFLEIRKPKQWDRKYRVLIFDISHKKKIKREALRGKLRELGFYLFQKSVWVHAFDCREEVALLRGFFGLTSDEMNLLLAEKIEDDKKLREFFKLDIV